MTQNTQVGYVPVNKAGDTMTGPLTLDADPTTNFEAATKQYVDSAVGGGAPNNATYIVQTPSAGLTNEQAMSALATSLVKNTTVTGIQSIAVPGTDYYAPGSTDVAVVDGGTGVSSLTPYAVICGGTTNTNPVQSVASVGTSGQVLTSNGAGALPTFQSLVAAGSLVFIGSVTANNSATVNFDNLLTATYDNYVIIAENVVPATNAAQLTAQIGTGATPTYQATNYLGAGLHWTTSSAGAVAASTTAHLISSSSNTPSNVAANAGQYVINMTGINSSLNKPLMSTAHYTYSASNLAVGMIYSGVWQTTTVLTSIRFQMTSGNISTGTFKLYGYKNS